MQPVKDSLVDLERLRRNLELELKGLKRGLQNWQTWDAEYEALKEEIEAAEEGQYEKILDEFEGELVQRKEVDEVIGAPGSRSKDQMIGILNHRIDYVTRNIASLQKQIDHTEARYNTASVISQPDEVQDEEGQPITEILEELDEDDNVISYNLNQPAQNMGHISEALKKAGVEDVPELGNKVPVKLPSAQEEIDQSEEEDAEVIDLKKFATKDGPIPKKAPKKSVSFAEEPESEAEEEIPRARQAVRRVENIMEAARQQKINDPVIPDEDSDDAAMRQEMLRYSMNEVGAVVGELQIEEGDPDDDDWDMDDEGFDEGFDEEESDGEDQWGRNGRVVTEAYKKQMLDLERKLGIQSRFSRDSRADTDGDADSDSDIEGIGRIFVNHNAESSSSSSQPPATKTLPMRPAVKEKQAGDEGKKKGVRFAESLDISEEPPPPQPVAPSVTEREPKLEPMSDLIVERDASTRNTNTKSDRKPSRFKSAKTKAPVFPDHINDNPLSPGYGKPYPAGSPSATGNQPAEGEQITPGLGPPGSTLSDNLVERDYITMSLDDFMEVDDESHVDDYEEVDPQELAAEHQKLRRKFINQAGGFLKEDENPIQPLDEEDGGPPRQSRFKAARLSRQ